MSAADGNIVVHDNNCYSFQEFTRLGLSGIQMYLPRVEEDPGIEVRE